MKIDKKHKQILLTSKDRGTWQIILYDFLLDDFINIKTMFTDKGYGLQVFGELPNEISKLDLIAIDDSNNIISESEYIGIWKLNKKVKRRIRKPHYLASSHKFKKKEIKALKK